MKQIHLNRQKGFTLVELVMVMVVLSILVLVVIAWPGKLVHLDTEAQKLMTDIRYTQFLAMSHNKVYRLHFSEGTATYTLKDGDGTNVALPATNTASRQLETGVTMGISSNLTNNYIGFDGLGKPYVSATGLLTDDATVTLSTEGESKVITISPETGKVGLPSASGGDGGNGDNGDNGDNLPPIEPPPIDDSSSKI